MNDAAINQLHYERLKKQIDFVLEVNKLKEIYRQSYINESGRRENDAEHSWHIALMAMLLTEHFEGAKEIDLLKVVKMLLIHDIVEIDAGDTYAYDEEGMKDKQSREMGAAKRIFALLPEDQSVEMWELWGEFEAMITAESRMANSLDRLQPLLLHKLTNGMSWQEHQVHSEQVYERQADTKDDSATIWHLMTDIIESSIASGILKK